MTTPPDSPHLSHIPTHARRSRRRQRHPRAIGTESPRRTFKRLPISLSAVFEKIDVLQTWDYCVVTLVVTPWPSYTNRLSRSRRVWLPPPIGSTSSCVTPSSVEQGGLKSHLFSHLCSLKTPLLPHVFNNGQPGVPIAAACSRFAVCHLVSLVPSPSAATVLPRCLHPRSLQLRRLASSATDLLDRFRPHRPSTPPRLTR